MQLAISRPATIGSLRPRLADPVAFSSLSESQPPNITRRRRRQTAGWRKSRPSAGAYAARWPAGVGNRCEKEHQHGIAGKLADTGADDLPFAQQLADQRPAERHLLVGRGAEAAAVFDMLALLLAKARIFMRFAVAAPPHRGQTECRRRQR